MKKLTSILILLSLCGSLAFADQNGGNNPPPPPPPTDPTPPPPPTDPTPPPPPAGLDMSNPGHPASDAVTLGNAADDSGGWLYHNNPNDPQYGHVQVNCLHYTSKGDSLWADR